MKIALIGYGKMGKEIETIALDRGHEIVLKIDITNPEDLTKTNLQKADVAIEFTTPASATANYKLCFEAGIPIVSGTTGWLEHLPEVHQLCNEMNGTFFYASNYSLGVNIFFALNKKLAELMAGHSEYTVELKEIHHNDTNKLLPIVLNFIQNIYKNFGVTYFYNRSPDISYEEYDAYPIGQQVLNNIFDGKVYIKRDCLIKEDYVM